MQLRRTLSPLCLSAAILTLILLLSTTAFALDGPTETVDPDREEAWLLRDLIHKVHAGRHGAQQARSNHAREIRNALFDVQHYDLELEIDRPGQQISGTCRITVQSTSNDLDQVSLHLNSLDVDGIGIDATSLSYSHLGEELLVDLDRVYLSGEEFILTIDYSGHPTHLSWGGFWFYSDMAFNMGVGFLADPPSMGRYWFPCLDEPDDKATFTTAYTVADTDMAVGNGLLSSVVEHPLEQTVTYTWDEPQQMATYLVAVAVGDWSVITDPVYPGLIRHYVLPGDSVNAVTSFQNVSQMMDAFTSRYAPYQFDKFSFVGVRKGDLEHQTLVAHLRTLINGGTYYDPLLAHELSHHWWGDWVTVADWRDVWLSEGFATYSEAIFKEHTGGMNSYHSYMNSSIMSYYLNSGETFPIYDPVEIWGATSYEKGASVLHMLRHIVGDVAFFDLLQSWGSNYGFGNAVSEDLSALASAELGQDMSWFFDQWLYNPGYPEYDWSWNWSSGAADTTLIYIDQTQDPWPLFTMPVDFLVSTSSGDTTITATVSEEHHRFTFVLDGPPESVVIDPDRWVLCRHTEVVTGVSVPPTQLDFDLMTAGPNPFSASTTMRLVAADGGLPVRVDIYDVEGRRVRRLLDRCVGPETVIEWNGRNDGGRALSSGVYFMRAKQGGRQLSHRVVLIR